MDFKFLSEKYKKKYSGAATHSAPPADWEDVINLSIGDPDISTPKIIVEKAFEDALAGHTKYTAPRGYTELRQAVCDFYADRYSHSITADNVFISTAGNVGMFLAMQAILDKGDEVIIIEPCFFPYPGQVEMAGGVPVFVSADFESGFQIDFDRLENAVSAKTKAIIINTPNNPTGVCYTRQTMKKLADFAVKHDLMVVADDIYTSFCYDEPFVPICTLPGMAERTITINSFSKNFIMTGFRIGNIVAPDYIIHAISDINEYVVYTAPSVSQRRALHGLEHFSDFEGEIVDTFRRRMEYAYERLSKMEFIDVLPARGSFYIFPCVKGSGLTGDEFAKKLYEECHVKTIPGSAFGKSGLYHIRISCTVGIDKLKEAFDRMEKMKF